MTTKEQIRILNDRKFTKACNVTFLKHDLTMPSTPLAKQQLKACIELLIEECDTLNEMINKLK